jgi:multidrug efflux pump subunit AcrB
MVQAVVVMFNAARQTLVIWLTVPLAIVGLLVFQVAVEFIAIPDFSSLIGMLVKNAMALVKQADAEREAGKPGLLLTLVVVPLLHAMFFRRRDDAPA